MPYIPGVDLNQIVDGKPLGDHWQYYTVNVKRLETMTHEEFCATWPHAAAAIDRASAVLDRLEKLAVEPLEGKDDGG